MCHGEGLDHIIIYMYYMLDLYGFIHIYIYGWWFGTFFIFHFIYEIIHQPLTFIVFKMFETTNQIVFMAISSLSIADLYGFIYGFIMIYSYIHVLYFGFKWIYNDVYIIEREIYIYLSPGMRMSNHFFNGHAPFFPCDHGTGCGPPVFP